MAVLGRFLRFSGATHELLPQPLRCGQAIRLLQQRLYHAPNRSRRVEPSANPSVMANVLRHVKTARRFCREPLTCAARGFQVEGKPAVAVMILKKPAESPAAHFETEVTTASGNSLRPGQRVHQGQYLTAALRRDGFIDSARAAHGTLERHLSLLTFQSLRILRFGFHRSSSTRNAGTFIGICPCRSAP